MVKVSVIIPVYNTESYLEKCLDSVCNQTLSDIEIICINDCSTDNSLKLLRQYSLNDNRIKVIDLKVNKGAAFTRNLGIDEALGDYIGFLDSDDFVDSNFYEKLYERAVLTNADISKGCYKYFETGYVNYDLNKKIKENYKNFSFEFCSAIFKKDIIKNNNIKFPLLMDMEDPVFTFSAVNCANKVELVENCYINIVKRDDSQTSRIPTEKQLSDKFRGLELLNNISYKYNISESVKGYVIALWTFIIMNSSAKANFYHKLHLAEKFLDLYASIDYKSLFLQNLQTFSFFLAKAVKEKNIEKMLSYNQESLLQQTKMDINENKKTIKVLEQYINGLINSYCIEKLKQSYGENTYCISVVNNYDLYNTCLKKNPFIENPKNIYLTDFDNTKENIFIPKRYNSFLDSYDYKNDAWFIFCHCDWQLMEDLNPKLKSLDKNSIYGTIGSIANFVKGKVFSESVGMCFEKRRNGKDLRVLGDYKCVNELSDTFDCQSLIVHSSLVEKYNLRFDENLMWDLYVEDFCINARKNFDIKSYTIPLYACHWSGYHNIPESYYVSLDYLNKKYYQEIYSGTVSLIGGKNFPLATDKDIVFYKLRNGSFIKNA